MHIKGLLDWLYKTISRKLTNILKNKRQTQGKTEYRVDTYIDLTKYVNIKNLSLISAEKIVQMLFLCVFNGSQEKHDTKYLNGISPS